MGHSRGRGGAAEQPDASSIWAKIFLSLRMCNILWQVEQEEEQEQDVAATAHSHKLNAKLFEFLSSSRWRPLPLPVPVQLRVWLPFCFVSLWRCFCQMNFAAAAHIKLPAARRNQAAGAGSRGQVERWQAEPTLIWIL